MKIKKVEISNFRAFENKEFSTFNFCNPNGETANFVSIYAPNGFGKTSFYDAVEWSVTGQIQRFHRHAREYTKKGLAYRKNNSKKPFFLQHHHSDGSLGYVNIDTEEKKFSRQLTTSKVYNFKNSGENHYFKDVIMSQELIDSFIKEEKAEDRYNKFVDNFPQLKDYNIKLDNLQKIKDVNGLRIKKLKEEINDLESNQLKIDLDQDKKVLVELNKYIKLTNDKKLKTISQANFTENSFKVLSTRISAQMSQLEIEIENKNTRIIIIDRIYRGTDEYLGVVSYFKLTQDKKDIINRIAIANKLKSYLILIDEHEKNSKLAKKDIANLFKIKDNFPQYITLKKSIDKLENNSKKLQDEINKKEKKKKDSQKIITKRKEDITLLKSKEVELKLKQKKCTSNSQKIEKLEQQIKKIRAKVLSQEVLNNLNTNEENISTNLTELKAFIANFKKEDINVKFPKFLLKRRSNLSTKIKEYYTQRKEVLQKIEQCNFKIQAQENLNKDLKTFISAGLEIISKSKEKTCPFCTQEYSSYVKLSRKVTSNELFDKLLNSLINEKLSFENKLQSIEKRIHKEKEQILSFVEKTRISLINTLQKNSVRLRENEKLLKSLKKLNDNQSDIFKFFEGFKPSEFYQKIELELKDIKNKSLKLSDKLSILLASNKLLGTQIGSITKETNNNEREIKKIKSNKKFSNIIDFFLDKFNSSVINIQMVNNEIEESRTEVRKWENEIREVTKKTTQLIKKLDIDEMNKKDLDKLIMTLKNKVNSIEKELGNFQQTVKSDLNVKIASKKEQVDSQFSIIKKKILNEVKQSEKIFSYYKTIDNLKQQTLDFLTAEAELKKIFNLQNKLDRFETTQSQLSSESDNLQKFLKSEINKFFYTDIINEIYQRIEPHPEYSRISFDCDFQDRNPRLQIFTVDEDDNMSIPSLYFSSAQINILSLSVFLARALKAKDKNGKPVKCIFIDDPIQSMDSINILSFIDLFRSFILNLDRQIVISTHEENFHNLLKKKIPSNYFKSKFITFETFGKLNNH